MTAKVRIFQAVFGAAALAVGATVVGVPGASAATSCTGTIHDTTVGDVDVPAGATCLILNSTVNGSVQVNAGASITLVGVTVNGNFNSTGAHDIRIGNAGEFGGPNRATVIKGNVNITGTTGVPSFPTQNVICDATVTGAYVVLQNNKAPFTIGTFTGQCNYGNGDTIGGSVIIAGNTAAVTLKGNKIAGALQCSANTPAPVNGGGNTAAAKYGQCAGF